MRGLCPACSRFDLQTRRVTVGVYHRVPATIWHTRIGITVVVMLEVGYVAGRAKAINWLAVIGLSVAFSLVVVLIADLDRTGAGAHGVIRYSHQPVIDLQKRLRAP